MTSALTLPRMLALPMSRPEYRLWRWLLGETKLQKLRRELRGIFGFKTSAFGPGSAGAGGPLDTDEFAELLDAKLFGDSGSSAGSTASGKKVRDPGNRYPWLFPTADFQPFDKYGTIALPAIAATFTSIGGTSPTTTNASSNLPFQVPNRFNGFVKTLANDFVANGGAAWVQGVLPAQLLFQILRQTDPVPDYGSFAYSTGLVINPTSISGFPIKEGEIVYFQVSNQSIAVTTQFVEARMQGYFYGKQLEPKEMWST